MSRPEPEARTGILVRLLEVVVVVLALFQRKPVQPALSRGVDAEDLAGGYEHSDMNPLVVGAAAVGLLIMLALVLAGATLVGQVFVRTPFSVSRPQDLISGLQAPAAPTPPPPSLESQPAQTVDPYRAAQQQKLNSYGWVDRSAGTIRIPIDRAMQLTAQRGLASRATSAPAAQDDGVSSPTDASSGRATGSYP
jgi:hypothetical protein